MAFMPPTEPLSTEEVEALAGVWRTSMKLDSGDWALSLHLDAGGQVHTTDDASLPFNICHGTTWNSATWRVSAVPESTTVKLKLQLGMLYFEGEGERTGLRCMSIKGSVLEGRDDPCCVGSFDMNLALPTISDVAPLEAAHKARVEARPAPPVSYKRLGFVGTWRLMLSLDDQQPMSFTVALAPNRTFHSVGAPERLAGTWGVYMRVNHRTRGLMWSSSQEGGTSLWLKVNREASSETMRGIADLSVRESFNLWGKPMLSFEAELAARTQPDLATADAVNGQLWMGAVERAYFGRFAMLREASVEEP